MAHAIIEVVKNYKLAVILEEDEDGVFVSCPALDGCYSQGDTREEALENIKDAIRLYLLDLIENNEEIPQEKAPEVETVEVTV